MEAVVSARVAIPETDPPRQVSGVVVAPVTEIGSQGTSFSAVAAPAEIVRALHVSERPPNASPITRAAGVYRRTMYKIV